MVLISQPLLFPSLTVADLDSSDQRYTPPEKVQLVNETLGIIHLDATADPTKKVKALHHLTEKDDCLTTDWIEFCGGIPPTRIYMNPPYSNAHPFIFRLCEYLESQPLAIAITLTHSSLIQTKTSQGYFKKYSRAICLPNSRINFVYPDGMEQKTGNDRDSLWTYWGNDDLLEKFKDVYQHQGLIYCG